MSINGQLTNKEGLAVAYFTQPNSETKDDWYKSYKKAKYSTKGNWTTNAIRVKCRDRIIRAIQAEQAKYAVKVAITREYLIQKLNDVILKPSSQSVMIQAAREIANICGYQREAAPNPEKEREMTEREKVALRKYSAAMALEADKDVKTIKIG